MFVKGALATVTSGRKRSVKALLRAVGLAVLLVATAPGIALSDYRLALYSDSALSDCTLDDYAPRTMSIYVAETSHEATGVRFVSQRAPGLPVYGSVKRRHSSSSGDSQTDLSIGFGQCLDGHFLVLTMTYQLFGTSTCSTLSIGPPPGFPVPLCTSCVFHEVSCAPPGALHVNCQGGVNCNPVMTEPTTWGKVKALYRN